MNNIKHYILLAIAGGIVFNSSMQGILRNVTETVENVTTGAAETVERVTGAIIPPAEKIVEVPLEVAKEATTAVADVFRDSTVTIINDADDALTAEIMNTHNKINKIIIINPGDQETFKKPYAIRLTYGDISTKISLDKKGKKEKPLIMNVSLAKGKIRIK